MSTDEPSLPDEYRVRFTQTPQGRIRSRILGEQTGAPPIVAVMGLTVSDYQLPALAELDWTQRHLIDLPGYGESVANWLRANDFRSTVLIGHSSGTQVAAHAAVRAPDRVGALVL